MNFIGTLVLSPRRNLDLKVRAQKLFEYILLFGETVALRYGLSFNIKTQHVREEHCEPANIYS